jgi:hypothetical protein
MTVKFKMKVQEAHVLKISIIILFENSTSHLLSTTLMINVERTILPVVPMSVKSGFFERRT